jgi:hypothetical protein
MARHRPGAEDEPITTPTMETSPMIEVLTTQLARWAAPRPIAARMHSPSHPLLEALVQELANELSQGLSLVPIAADGQVEDDSAAAGCGWYQSSFELRRGLDVIELAPPVALRAHAPVRPAPQQARRARLSLAS